MKNQAPITVSDVREYQFDESVGYLLSRVKSTMLNMITQRTMTEFGITSAQGRLLFMVASGKCELAAELARESGVDASSVTRLVDRLEKRALLTRIRSSEDRRHVRLAPTPEGHSIAARMPSIFNGVLENLLSDFTADEVGALKGMLRRILVNSGELTGADRDIAIDLGHIA
jgi:DNA-binding MarR family transcriptional regulator